MDIKDTDQKNTVSNGQLPIEQAKNAFYTKHSVMSFISKKTEKIATAIYMVTDFVSDSEPLKQELRTLALALLSSTRKLHNRSDIDHSIMADEVVRTIEDILVFLSLGSTIGIISIMNESILRNELGKVRESLQNTYGKNTALVVAHPGYANIILNRSMFDLAGEMGISPDSSKGQEISKGHNEQINVLYKKVEKTPSLTLSISKKTDLGNKIARRNDVLTVVRNKGKVSIKDISQILKDISDKTIQRELHGLVQEGVLVKEGEKRWSMYKIAQ